MFRDNTLGDNRIMHCMNSVPNFMLKRSITSSFDPHELVERIDRRAKKFYIFTKDQMGEKKEDILESASLVHLLAGNP
jgi:hypothetical protein